MKLEKVTLSGPLGQALKHSVRCRLKTLDYHLLVEPFRLRNEADDAWRCEFWGKIVRSAILSNVFVRDAELAAIIDKTVQEMLAAQTPDGCISSYPAEKQLGGWDVWGRKYVLLALVRYYEMVRQDAAVRTACIRMLDQFIAQLHATGKPLREFGWHDGLAACSIFDAVIGVYRISGEPRFLDFAEEIREGGCSTRHNIYTAAGAGTPPAALGNGKAYEMTSCFQGLAELHLLRPQPEAEAILLKYYEMVRDQEIFVTGTAGCVDRWGEYWGHGALEQTAPREGSTLGETCVTATWLHYCDCMYRLTGRADIMDEAEKTLYNAALGAMDPDGSRWLHGNPTPLTGGGTKKTADDQIGRGFGTPFGGNDCCRAQGPEALAFAPVFAFAVRQEGIAVNFYEAAEAEFTGGKLAVSGNYPYAPEAVIRAEGKFSLYLRRSPDLQSAELNGTKLELPASGYLRLEREWKPADKLRLAFDFAIKEVAAPGDRPYYAVKRGPLVLAEDARGTVPAAVHAEYRGHILCEYASAGNPPDEDYPLTVWFRK